jgi:hypothetical protein
MPAHPIPRDELEVATANILGLDLDRTVQGSLRIERIPGDRLCTSGRLRAKWDGAMILTAEQEAAVTRLVDEREVRSRAAQALAALSALPPDECRRVLAELEEITNR